MRSFIPLALAAVTLRAAAPESAPAVALPFTEQRSITSGAIGQQYDLLVQLPDDYATSGKSYPVLYVLDGWHFAAGIERSMSRAGNCYDNATMESFWSTLKSDTGLDESIPASRHNAKLAVFDYIETFYNRSRRHSSLGQISPVAFENQHKLNDNQAA